MTSDKFTTPWAYTPEEFVDGLLFHASVEPWKTQKAQVGRYDACFWAADNPLVAQTYIPCWPGTASVNICRTQFHQPVRPDRGLIWTIAQALGARAQVDEYDATGHARRWSSQHSINYSAVVEFLQSQGYVSDVGTDFQAWIKTAQVGNDTHIVAATSTPWGRLVMIDPLDDLNLHDLSVGEADLTDPQYHKTNTFKRAFEAGADCVKIDDVCQSPAWGNVEHPSWGFSASSLAKHAESGRMVSICATHRDWVSLRDRAQLITKDIEDWHFSQVLGALANNLDVPAPVLMAYAERLESLLEQPGQTPVVSQVNLDAAPMGIAPFCDKKVQTITTRILTGQLPTDKVCFAQRANGKVTGLGVDPLLEASVVQAARQAHAMVPVPAVFLNDHLQPLRVQELERRLDCLLANETLTDNASPRIGLRAGNCA